MGPRDFLARMCARVRACVYREVGGPVRITRKKESRRRRARDGRTTRFRRNSSRRKKHDTHDLLISPLTKIMFVHRIASKKSLLLNRTIRSNKYDLYSKTYPLSEPLQRFFLNKNNVFCMCTIITDNTTGKFQFVKKLLRKTVELIIN